MGAHPDMPYPDDEKFGCGEGVVGSQAEVEQNLTRIAVF
jgi:hypothetical protein